MSEENNRIEEAVQTQQIPETDAPAETPAEAAQPERKRSPRTQKIITGLIMSAIVLLLIYFGNAVFAVVAIVVVCLSLYEEYDAMSKAGHRLVCWPTWVAAVVSIPLALIYQSRVLIPILMACCLVTLLCILFRSEPRLVDALMSVCPLFFVLLPGLGIISLATVQPLSVQRTLNGLLIAVPVLGDTMAFFVGSKVRGPKLCPAVSPNKTVSGAIAGLVGSLMAALITRGIAELFCVANKSLLPGWWAVIALGLIGGVAAQAGDLFASLVKRHCGIKDFSNLFPGHGGMMDRLDSVLFMALVLMCYRLFALA
ncbi:MAG: phosphatidate cytidylyltransferase [Clostridia bacterium]|nr:phosphatidate cytidylyltransferase [Clostridia bacterium]